MTVGRGSRQNGEVKLELSREIHFPHSLGMFYSTITAYLGFPVNEGEYKVMGLASYGKPSFQKSIDKVIKRTPDGAFKLNLDYFEFQRSATRSFSKKFVDEIGPPRHPHQAIDLSSDDGKRYADIAASAQLALEDILVDIAGSLRRETGLTDLCLSGGVALNGCANARILRESGFERVFIPPAPGDAGGAVGAALYADRIHFGHPDREIPDHPFWGPSVDRTELAELAFQDQQPVEEI